MLTVKVLTVKVGGGAGNALDGVLDDLAALWRENRPWVLVHGGSERTNEISEALGRPPVFVTSPNGFTSRRTDRETALIFTMVYAGDVNKRIVEGLQARGVNAVGLSGLDGRLLEARRKAALKVVENGRTRVLRDEYTGTVRRVNAELLGLLIGHGLAPVVSPPAISAEHEILNVDGDRAAAAIAAALGGDELLLLTGAPGLLADPREPASLIPSLPRAALDQAGERYAEGRMRIKLRAAAEALDGGVKSVTIAASRKASPVRSALAGEGTVIR